MWKKQELFEIIQESLVQQTRLKKGKKEQPTVGIIDAQSVKSTLVSSESKGFNAGKRIKGIKAAHHCEYRRGDTCSNYLGGLGSG